MVTFANEAPGPASGGYEDGYEALAQVFAEQLERGEEVGAGVAVYHRGVCVVDLWGGLADRDSGTPWTRDTRIVLFSVTKGFAAMALNLLADRGLLDWDAPVADHWPGFAQSGKAKITVRTLLNHRGGLPFLDRPLSLEDCIDPARADVLRDAMERQAPAWNPGEGQGYHAVTFGFYAKEIFERIAGEPMGDFLTRELFEPLDSDVRLGTPASFDDDAAELYPPATLKRVRRMISSAVMRPDSTEAHVARQFLKRDSMMRKAFLNPKVPRGDVTVYNAVPVRRAALAWASATGTARGVARAYLPFAMKGEFAGKRYFDEATIAPVYERQGWSTHDAVLQKPVGWSQGFLKEETHLFSPNEESFGHAGMGGALGWCDPTQELTFGYAMNFMDWRIRSPRAVALCNALYRCDAVRG